LLVCRSTPKAFANVSPGLLQPWDSRALNSNAESVDQHLRELANGDRGDHPIVLIQIQDDPKDSRAVEAMPDGAHVTKLEFPKDMQVMVQTPWDFTVVGGTVTVALDPETIDPEKR